jgi:lysophospholipase L1-like esterase
LIVLTAAAGTAGGPVSPGPAAAIVAGTVVAAALSWRFIEEPIRRGARLRWVVPASEPSDTKATGGADMTGEPGTSTDGGGRRPGWLSRPGALQSPLAVGGLCLLAAAVLAGCVTASTRLASAAHPPAHPPAHRPSAQASTTRAPLSSAAAKPGNAATAKATTKTAAAGSAAVVPALPTPPPRTSCASVVHIGDSTSEGLISADYEPNPANRIPARYADVGARQSIMKIVGATSVVESLPGTPNALDLASQVKQGGFNGCWVLALGTNDTADVYVGSNVDRLARIQKMMNLIGNHPVMWVEVTSLLSSGPYAEQNMELWNQALQQAQAQYPSMRIYNWPAVAQRSWFISDGIHYTSNGYAHRATDIADALAKAFPAS